MTHISQRVQSLVESATIAMTAKSRELKAQGLDIISLSIGEPDFNTPDHVKNAAKKAIDDNFSKYPPVAGYPDLQQAIANKFKRENNIEYAPNQIVVSTGAKQSIANVILAIIDPGDEVILPAPYWVSYADLVKLAGGVPVEVKAGVENDFKITAKQLADAITKKTRLIVYSSPCNPSGSVYSAAELEGLAKEVIKHEELYVLADEIYEYINFTSERTASMASFDFVKDRVITVNGVAKGFAMTGWRIGYMGAPLWLAKACDKLQGQITSGANTIAQKATVAAVNEGINLTHEMKAAFLRRRDLVLGKLKEIPGLKTNVPQGAFYIFPDVSYYLGKKFKDKVIKTGDDLAMFLLDEALVACVGGDSFGSPECIRISYATSDDVLVEAISRIKKALEKLA
ncbi:MAG: pyridoxal phosphate-dependent aminotransferase [Bacteroidetes bacterium]|nr:pyridoxal phosphate-dependent aminotransferase [Bacteroidota bacterium]